MARKTLALRKNPKEEERRAAIIEAAIHVFSSKGYDDATMDDIAVESGCSKGLIYWYWKNKPALYSELIDKCFTIYSDFIHRILQLKVPYGQKLNQFSWEMVEIYKENDRLNRLVHFGSLHHSKRKQDDFSSRVNDGYNNLITLLKEFLQQGIDFGYLRKDLDVEAVAFHLLFSVEGYLYMTILEHRMPFERAFGSVWTQAIIPSLLRSGRK